MTRPSVALAEALRSVVGKLKRRLRDQADTGDLTPSQTAVLLRLEKDGPATASGLGRAEGMRPQSMAPVIAALESAGLVKGAPDPADGRQTLFSLTDACRKWVAEGRLISYKLDGCRRFDPEDVDDFVAGLRDDRRVTA